MTENTLDRDDDLTPLQEYIVVGIVILLFGLLYWLLNHGWNNDSAITLPQAHLAVAELSSKTEKKAVPHLAITPQADPTIEAPKAEINMTSDVVGKPTVATIPATVMATTTKTSQPTTADIAAQQKAATIQAKALQAEIEQLKAENTAMKQAEKDRIKAEQSAKQQAAVTTPETTDNTQTAATEPSASKEEPLANNMASNTQAEQQQAAETNVYQLPDGSSVELAASGMEPDFKQAIINREYNKPLVFDGIYFDPGSPTPSPHSEHQIKAIAALMHQYPDINVLVRGHTDNTGQPTNNVQLSLFRANSVGLALVAQGIERSRIRIMGMGDTDPIDTNATEQGRQNNRRIDISIIH